MDNLDLLRTLSECFGPSGFEEDVRDAIKARIARLVDDLRIDPLGNLIATINPGNDFTLLLDAHMDEIGFMVSHIEDNGFVRFAPIGSWDERLLPALRIEIKNRDGKLVPGTIGSTPPHIQSAEEKKSPVKIDDLFIDVGTESGEAAGKMGIRPGDPIAPKAAFLQMENGMVMGKAFDDRAGCAVLIRVLEAFHRKQPDFTLVACFSVCEEVGLRGAKTAAFQVQPTVALALEGTVAADTPGTPGHKNPSRMGKGPAVTLADRSIIVHPRLARFIERTAEEEKIPYQIKTPIYGATDAGSIHLSGAGALTGVISIPCRYIHSPNILMNLTDFENTVRLVTAVSRRLKGM
ncbi:MAG: M42 family peptidase [Desulfobacteraceae bacterium]|nr:MAG: M42 family peptidase [Desulfobacteraceae bacterium]